MKPGIYLETTPASIFGSAPAIGIDKQHTYLIYRKADGTTEVIRGGPSPKNNDLRIEVETGKTLEQSKDRYTPGDDASTRPSQRLDIPDDKLDESWAKMRGTAEEIGQSGLSYRYDSDTDVPDQTSNSITRAALDSINYSIKKALPPDSDLDKMPGIKDNLEEKHRLRREEIKKGQEKRAKKQSGTVKRLGALAAPSAVGPGRSRKPANRTK